MTDRVHSFVVVLRKDLRDDDAENIAKCLSMIKGVMSVVPAIATPETLMAEQRARAELGDKLLQIIFPDRKV